MALDLDHRAVSPAPSAPIALPRGPRVTVRGPRPRDLDGVRALATKAGLICEDLELARLVRPEASVAAGRLVLCATAAVDDAEAIVGLGVIELGLSATMPTLLLVDVELTDGLHEVLAAALLDRARELADADVA